MPTMTAYQIVEWGEPARFTEVEVPRPGPGEVLLRVAGVGLCHSDILFLDAPPGVIPYPLPFTLGHESAGWVEECGEGVDDLAVGASVAVVGVPSCGRCRWCVRGHDNYCPRGQKGRGYGEDGGLAGFLVVPRRELVPLTTLDPRRVGPLADAGTTSFHAVKKALPKLVPGTTAVVIGAGGLGGYAVQYLRLLTQSQVIAVDVAEHRLEFASELGAHHTLPSDDDTARRVRELTGGDGAAAVFDFVGIDSTMATAMACARILGTIAFVGAGGGTARVGWGSLPLECEVFIPMAGTIADLQEVIAIAETGALRVEVELFPFEEAPEAYERLRRGDLKSRAVVTPNG
jgi:alcohol dehydrogenase, propanol-preferring